MTVALVLTGWVASEIDGLRRGLGSEALRRIPPHLTVVPPVNVREEEIESALGLVRRSAESIGPIGLEIGPAATFLPGAPVVYLAVAGAMEELDALRRQLDAPPLTAPASRPIRPYVPHVTLDQRAEPARIPAALAALADYRVVTTVEYLTLLEFDEETRRWHPLAEPSFGPPRVAGRGGIEIELRAAAQLDPAEAEFRKRAWDDYEQAAYGDREAAEPFAVTARARGVIVGVATGQLQGREPAYLGYLIVSPSWRSMGVGSQLLREVERVADGKGAPSVRLLTRKAGPAAPFYESRGYEVVAHIPKWRFGEDFVLRERRL